MLLDIVLIVIGRIIVYILQLVVGGGRVGGNVFFLFNNTQPKINYNYNFLGALSGYPLLVLAAGKLKPNPSPATQFNYAPNLLMLTAAVGYTLLSGAQEYHM
jgi:hypothetical protein